LPEGKDIKDLHIKKNEMQKLYEEEIKRLNDLMKDFSKKYLAELMSML